mgnify:CR=1 FL=1
MHERSGVAYTQTEPLEMDCYHELASCDIVVCIIGNHFGSKSSTNDFSITMNEINTAIKNKKKVRLNLLFLHKFAIFVNYAYFYVNAIMSTKYTNHCINIHNS